MANETSVPQEVTQSPFHERQRVWCRSLIGEYEGQIYFAYPNQANVLIVSGAFSGMYTLLNNDQMQPIEDHYFGRDETRS